MYRRAAPVAELVDAIDSKSIVHWDVLVRFRSGAPSRIVGVYEIHDHKIRSACFVRTSKLLF